MSIVRYLTAMIVSSFLAYSYTASANSDVVLISPVDFKEKMAIPVTLSWSLIDPQNEVALVRVEVFETDTRMNIKGAPVWSVNLFNVRQNQVLVDYRNWASCGQYAWRVTIYKPGERNRRGEYFVNNQRYAKVKSSLFRYFTLSCEKSYIEDVESAGYFDFPNENTPYVFSQKEGADIRFHYFSPYENNVITCKIYNWQNNTLLTKEFVLKKGSNYIIWQNSFTGIGSGERNEVLTLEVTNSKEEVKGLKFTWKDE